MIEPSDEMIYAFAGEPEITATDAHAISVGLAAVLAVVEREYVILPRGAQALCCPQHPDRPLRWGQCGLDIAEPSEQEWT